MDKRARANKTENRGLTALRVEVDKHDRLNIEAPDAGKTPAWDGHIYVYSTPEQKRETLLGRIPIQVKGTTVKKFHSGTRTFSTLPAHLLSYKSEFGALFFVTEIIESTKDCRLFYATLLPYDIVKYLKENEKSKKNKIIISLKEYIASDINGLDLICRNFLCQRELQASKEPVDMEKLKGIEKLAFSVVAKDGNVIGYLLSESSFLYAIDHNKTRHLIEKFEATSVAPTCTSVVSVKGHVYFSTIIIEYHRNGNKYIRLGKNILVESEKINITIGTKEPFADQTNEMSFFISAVKNKGFEIDGNPFEFHFDSNDKSYSFFETIKAQLENIQNLCSVLQFLGISDFGKPDDYANSEMAFLKYLVDTKILQKDVSCPFSMGNGFISVTIAKRKLQLFHHNGKIWNVFSREFSSEIQFTIVDKSGITQPVGPYCSDNPGALIRSANFLVEPIIESLEKIPITGLTSERYTSLLLATLHEFDRQPSRMDVYDLAVNLSSLLLEHEKNEVNQVNYFQTIKRMHILSQVDRDALKEICKHTERVMIRCASAILLDDISMHKELFAQLSSSERNDFEEFPIYNLAKMALNQ